MNVSGGIAISDAIQHGQAIYRSLLTTFNEDPRGP
jgi:hypothetical protein